jgi:hypothetical protein
MAKAKQVGNPHSLQLVLARSLKISIPVKAIVSLLIHGWWPKRG